MVDVVSFSEEMSRGNLIQGCAVQDCTVPFSRLRPRPPWKLPPFVVATSEMFLPFLQYFGYSFAFALLPCYSFPYCSFKCSLHPFLAFRLSSSVVGTRISYTPWCKSTNQSPSTLVLCLLSGYSVRHGARCDDLQSRARPQRGAVTK